MPRKERIEYPGAVYHIISRGNYRKNLFSLEGSGESFEKALFEVVERCRWKLLAYVIMSNHYHLAVKTPDPNLVVGMKWLQGTFATRFNQYHKERGHVFQGRYKSILVEEDRPLLGLINYIHLNPVRAGLCEVGELQRYKLSSYPKYWKRVQEKVLNRSGVLSLADLPDTLLGMRSYQDLLMLSEESNPERRDELQKKYCRGWFLGSKQAQKNVAKDLVALHPHVTWSGGDLRALNEESWERIVKSELIRLNREEDDIREEPKGVFWKALVAQKLRRETTAGNPWIANRLNMGHPNRVSMSIKSLNVNI